MDTLVIVGRKHNERDDKKSGYVVHEDFGFDCYKFSTSCDHWHTSLHGNYTSSYVFDCVDIREISLDKERI